jgi:hypothetical protein
MSNDPLAMTRYTTLTIAPDASGDIQVSLTVSFDNESPDRASAVAFLRAQLELVLTHLETA